MNENTKPNNYRNFLLKDIRTFKSKRAAYDFVDKELMRGVACQYEQSGGVHQVRVLEAV